MERSRSIIILMSGGDSPTMSASLFAAVTAARNKYSNIYVCFDAFRGLVEDKPGDIVSLEKSVLSAFSSNLLIQSGYSVLHCPRYDFKPEECVMKATQTIQKYGEGSLENCDLLTIGGDGTMMGTLGLTEKGVHAASVCASIDCDLNTACNCGSVDYMGGFATAIDSNVSLLDALRRSGEASNRYDIVQVMGRNSGYLSLMTALASGSLCVIPEKTKDWSEDDFEDYFTRTILDMNGKGIKSFSFVVSEGITPVRGGTIKGFNVDPKETYVYELAKKLTKKTELVVRANIAGYEQRAGIPNGIDRVLSIATAQEAVNLLYNDINKNYLVTIENGHLKNVELKDAAIRCKENKTNCNTVQEWLYAVMKNMYPDWAI